MDRFVGFGGIHHVPFVPRIASAGLRATVSASVSSSWQGCIGVIETLTRVSP